MELSPTLAADLAILNEVLDESNVDLCDTLRQLTAAAEYAVSSYLGLTATTSINDRRITFTTLDPDPDTGSGHLLASLRLSPLPQVIDAVAPVITLILFACKPGAFTDLAADLAWMTGRRLDEFALDRDLTMPKWPDASNGLSRRSVIDQAIGVLIADGHTLERAHRELDARAAHTGADSYTAAKEVLDRMNMSAPGPIDRSRRSSPAIGRIRPQLD